MEKYFKRYKIEAEPFNSEILSSILWELEIDGINEEDDYLFVFTSENSTVNKTKLSDQLNKLKKEKLIDKFKIEEEQIHNKNWNEEWEKTIDVVKVSDRIIIKPSFRKYKKGNDEIVITIDPKMSFGTGNHATTKLVAQMLEKYIKGGERVLDVGSGTGILAITAIKLGALSSIAIDNDEWCYDNAIENCKLNNVENKIEIRNCELSQVEEKDFSVVISNIQKNVLKDLATEFKSRIKEKGILILSGLLESDKQEMIEYYSNYGFELLDSSRIDEWVSLVFNFE